MLPAVAELLAERDPEALARVARALEVPPEDVAGTLRRFIAGLEVPTRLSDTTAKRDEIPLVAHAVAEELGRMKAAAPAEAELAALLEEVW